jgi:hypothetical protein
MTKTNTVALVFFMFLLPVTFNIASIIIGFEEAGDSCQRPDKTGLSLANWLQITGITGLSVNFVMAGFLCCLGRDGDRLVFDEVAAVGFIVTAILNILFTIAWFVIGIVLMARSDGACVVDSTSLGVMAMIMVVLQGIAVCSFQTQTSAAT